MRSKAPLALMEQLVMILVFALAAALCVQVFVFADQTSQRHEEQDRALVEAQNAAETLKAVNGDFAEAARQYGGTWDGLTWDCPLDETWAVAGEDASPAYRLLVTPEDSETPLLGTAEIAVYTAEGDSMAVLSVAWQEADASGEGADADA